MKFVIVTGMSGAGKSLALKYFEDIGFFCADNLPPALISTFAEICVREESGIDRIAVGVDIRGGKLFHEIIPVLAEIKEKGYNYDVVFLDADDSALLKRYKETRRNHPLSKDDTMSGILNERALLSEIKEQATYIIDTTHFSTRDLRETITNMYVENHDFDSLIITVMSFGFKYGIPPDSDLVFDVRFIPNPFYVPELKFKTGNDKDVRDYVMDQQAAQEFVNKLEDMILFLLPNFLLEGKNHLVISIGCTGGKHRSVTIANALYAFLADQKKNALIKHRDILI